MVTHPHVPDYALHLFDGANVGHLVTLNPDGTPHVTPVWVDRDGSIPRCNTEQGRVKARNVARDPTVALSITRADDPYNWVSVVGRADVVVDADHAHIHALARKYLGRDYPFLEGSRERLTIRIVPERVLYGEVRALPDDA